jgi:hypothetical protein
VVFVFFCPKVCASLTDAFLVQSSAAFLSLGRHAFACSFIANASALAE